MSVCRRLHGRRGLKSRNPVAQKTERARRRLHGRRGLKWRLCAQRQPPGLSPPSRAAWIEITSCRYVTKCRARRRLHGRRGLKCAHSGITGRPDGRRLHGRRGLKWQKTVRARAPALSPPSRAAWIEIVGWNKEEFRAASRRLHGRRGLKYADKDPSLHVYASPPSRAAWIEIPRSQAMTQICRVAAFTGGVD